MLHENTNYIHKLGSNFCGYKDFCPENWIGGGGGDKLGFPKIEGVGDFL